ncbi:hypothetical protein DFH09DRAFT_1283101 [Mycena vulgaris]|nr:hypothetical protein DFH09DRAFT_1283101 [Mycena vulgaris]
MVTQVLPNDLSSEGTQVLEGPRADLTGDLSTQSQLKFISNAALLTHTARPTLVLRPREPSQRASPPVNANQMIRHRSADTTSSGERKPEVLVHVYGPAIAKHAVVATTRSRCHNRFAASQGGAAAELLTDRSHGYVSASPRNTSSARPRFKFYSPNYSASGSDYVLLLPPPPPPPADQPTETSGPSRARRRKLVEDSVGVGVASYFSRHVKSKRGMVLETQGTSRGKEDEQMRRKMEDGMGTRQGQAQLRGNFQIRVTVNCIRV